MPESRDRVFDQVSKFEEIPINVGVPGFRIPFSRNYRRRFSSADLFSKVFGIVAFVGEDVGRVREFFDELGSDLRVMNFASRYFKINRATARIHGQMEFRGEACSRSSNCVINFFRRFRRTRRMLMGPHDGAIDELPLKIWIACEKLENEKKFFVSGPFIGSFEDRIPVAEFARDVALRVPILIRKSITSTVCRSPGLSYTRASRSMVRSLEQVSSVSIVRGIVISFLVS